MPIYDIECPVCGVSEDVFISLKDYTPDGPPCPECGGRARRIVAPVMTVGPMPSKPFTVKQIGRAFESQGELRRYMAENPGTNFVDKSDASYRAHYDKAHEKADAASKRAGYNDNQDRKTQRRREKATGG